MGRTSSRLLVRGTASSCSLFATARELEPLGPPARKRTKATASSEAAPVETYRRRAWRNAVAGTYEYDRARAEVCTSVRVHSRRHAQRRSTALVDSHPARLTAAPGPHRSPQAPHSSTPTPRACCLPHLERSTSSHPADLPLTFAFLADS